MPEVVSDAAVEAFVDVPLDVYLHLEGKVNEVRSKLLQLADQHQHTEPTSGKDKTGVMMEQRDIDAVFQSTNSTEILREAQPLRHAVEVDKQGYFHLEQLMQNLRLGTLRRATQQVQQMPIVEGRNQLTIEHIDAMFPEVYEEFLTKHTQAQE